MNVFVLDNAPDVASTMVCNQHLNKMVLEIAQILCDVALDLGQDPSEVPYKHTKGNQAPQRWVARTFGNWTWALQHGFGLLEQLGLRFGRDHACRQIFTLAESGKLRRPDGGSIEPFPKTWAGDPVLWLPEDPVQSHRLYYARKRELWGKDGKQMTWSPPSSEPAWLTSRVISFEERQLEKQASRDEDARRLSAGEVTREELRRENGHFAFPEVVINFASAKALK